MDPNGRWGLYQLFSWDVCLQIHYQYYIVPYNYWDLLGSLSDNPRRLDMKLLETLAQGWLAGTRISPQKRVSFLVRSWSRKVFRRHVRATSTVGY
jgi:hypothetical protein